MGCPDKAVLAQDRFTGGDKVGQGRGGVSLAWLEAPPPPPSAVFAPP